MQRADLLAAHTEVPGEITRPYGTTSLVRALDTVDGWMREAGLHTSRDAVGSVIGRRGEPGLPTFVLGSHVDSVRNAGRYDGPLGVLTAIAAAERIRGDEIGCALEIVCFADEEGLRFRSSYLASRAYTGVLTAEELAVEDEHGVPLADAVRATGGDPARIAGRRSAPPDLAGYLEVHIEQGPVLEARDLPVGVVTAIAGQSRGSVEIQGRAGHAGNTPAELRRDALAGAAELVLEVEAAMRSGGVIATVGRIENSPNVGNVISGLTTVSYDVRAQDDGTRAAAVDALRTRAAQICSRRGLELEWRPLQDHPAVPMSGRLRAVLRTAIAATGVRPFELPSGAGHDAVSVAKLTPEVAMLFVRCKDGVSHHPDESVREGDVAVAIDAVSEFLREVVPASVHERGELAALPGNEAQ
jgi:allantoate deiminase